LDQVEGYDVDLDIAEDAEVSYILSQAMEDVERVAGEDPFPEAYDVSLVVVFRGFDQHDFQSFNTAMLYAFNNALIHGVPNSRFAHPSHCLVVIASSPTFILYRYLII